MPETNWAGNLTFGAARVHRPSTVDEVRAALLDVRAVRAVHDLLRARRDGHAKTHRLEILRAVLTHDLDPRLGERGKVEVGEPQVDGDPPGLLLGPAVAVDAGEGQVVDAA